MVPLSLFCRYYRSFRFAVLLLIDNIHGQQDGCEERLYFRKILPRNARLSRYPTIRHHRFPCFVTPASSSILPFPHPSFRLFIQTTGKFNLMIDRMLAAAGSTCTPRSLTRPRKAPPVICLCRWSLALYGHG